MKVYVHPNADGLHSFMVAASSQKEACGLIGCTVGDFKRMGGRSISKNAAFGIAYARRALDGPGKVWKKAIMKGSEFWRLES